MTEIFIFIMWCTIAIADGVRDAWTFHRSPVGVNPLPKDIHVPFTSHRIKIGVTIVGVYYFICHSWFDTGVLALTLILVFPYWHDGAYYNERNKLNPGIYPNGFADQSLDTSAKLSLPFMHRFSFLILGILLITLYHLLK